MDWAFSVCLPGVKVYREQWLTQSPAEVRQGLLCSQVPEEQPADRRTAFAGAPWEACADFCGPCDDPRVQEEIQNRLKPQNQDSWKSRTSNSKRPGWGWPLACLSCSLYTCPGSSLQFIRLHSSKQFFMQIWAADVTHACVNTSMCLQQGTFLRSSPIKQWM